MRRCHHDRLASAPPQLLHVDAVPVDRNRNRLQMGALGDQPVLRPAGVLDRDPLDAAIGERPA
jgi:hypothetical protein